MKKTLFLFWCILSIIVANAQEVVTRSNINLRLAPTAESKVVYHIPKGTAIDLNGCQEDWCEVSVSGHSGFIAKQYTVSRDEYRALRYEQPHPIGAVRHYTNSRGNEVQSPTMYNKQPAGATAQCRDGTYSFSQSRRGTCSHHGGVARWLQ
jgi:uncharacterized protein YgiM (DUF1202 family)